MTHCFVFTRASSKFQELPEAEPFQWLCAAAGGDSKTFGGDHRRGREKTGESMANMDFLEELQCVGHSTIKRLKRT